MSTYHAPLTDMRFVLFDVLGARSPVPASRLRRRHARRARCGARRSRALHRDACWRRSTPSATARAASSTRPAARSPRRPGFKQAYAQFVEGGWSGLTSPAEFGGQGMPHAAGVPLKEMIDAANLAWGNFPLLSHGATEALLHHGEAWQQEVFLKPLVDGRWTGTMCLTEPHCGTDLGLLKTRAEPQCRRQLFDHRHQDLHHRRRARLHRQHRAPGARAPARCAGRQQGHLAVRRAQAPRRSRRQCRRTQCGALRRHRAQDGHPRLGHLRDQLRRRAGLSDRRSRTRAWWRCSR